MEKIEENRKASGLNSLHILQQKCLWDVCHKKKRENVGIFKKQGEGSTRIPFPFFTVFNMGDPPTINVPKVLKCKKKHDIPKLGGGGVPDLGKTSTFSCFFLGGHPSGMCSWTASAQ